VASGELVIAEGVLSIAQNNRPKWRVSASFRSNSDVPQKMMAMRHHALKKVQRLYKNIKLYNFSQNL